MNVTTMKWHLRIEYFLVNLINITIFHFWLHTYCVLSNNLLTSYPPFSSFLFTKHFTLILFSFSSSIVNVVCRQWYRFMFIKYSHECRVWHQQRKRQSGKSSFKHFFTFFASLIFFFCILIQLLCFMLTLYEQQQQLTLFFLFHFFCFI